MIEKIIESILRSYLPHFPATRQNQLYHSWQMFGYYQNPAPIRILKHPQAIFFCAELFTPNTFSLILIWTFPAAMLFQNYFFCPAGKWNLFILVHFAAAFYIVQNLEGKWQQFSLHQTKQHQFTQSSPISHIFLGLWSLFLLSFSIQLYLSCSLYPKLTQYFSKGLTNAVR